MPTMDFSFEIYTVQTTKVVLILFLRVQVISCVSFGNGLILKGIWQPVYPLDSRRGSLVPTPPPITSPTTTIRDPSPTTLGHATTSKKGTGDALHLEI